MTVIAYDAELREIAVESLCTDSTRKYYYNKFRMLADGTILFVHGVYANLYKAARLLDEGKELTSGLLSGSNFVVFDPATGKCWEYDDSPERQLVKRNEAWGSGADYAVGAMAMGATAQRAVEVACSYSPSCGGKIHHFTRM